jgi:acetyl-CoA synthetase
MSYAGQIVKVFVALKPGHAPNDAPAQGTARLCSHSPGAGGGAARTGIHGDLPKTRSGKIMRRLLRAQELGLPLGDLSTLENSDKNA